MILISFNGEQQLVDTLDGCAGCTVIADNVDPPTDPDATWTDGAWKVSIDTLKARKRGEVDAYLGGQFANGYTPSNAALAGHVLQMRDDTDRTNWMNARSECADEVAAGNGATMGADFRTEDNSTVTLSYSDGLTELNAMRDWAKSLMKKSWTLKDQIDALTDGDAVTSYDVPTQWAAA